MLHLTSDISLVLDIERRVPETPAALAMQVLLQLCGAHLRGGDAKQALKCLESAGLDDSRAAGLPADAQQMVLRVKLEAGLLAEVGTNAGGSASSGRDTVAIAGFWMGLRPASLAPGLRPPPPRLPDHRPLPLGAGASIPAQHPGRHRPRLQRGATGRAAALAGRAQASPAQADTRDPPALPLPGQSFCCEGCQSPAVPAQAATDAACGGAGGWGGPIRGETACVDRHQFAPLGHRSIAGSCGPRAASLVHPECVHSSCASWAAISAVMQDEARRYCQQMVLEALALDQVAAYMCKV